MDTGKAIFFGLALIALAVFASDMMKPAEAGLMGSGRYVGVSEDSSLLEQVWVVDTETGKVRICWDYGNDKSAVCRNWSD